MKINKSLLASSLAVIFLSVGVSAKADTGVFVGIVYNFGSNAGPGLSVKLVSDDEDDKVVAAIGVSYFPKAARRVGVDLSAGYTFDNGLVTAGYDFVNGVPQLGLGYMDTDNGTTAAPALPPPAASIIDDGSELR